MDPQEQLAEEIKELEESGMVTTIDDNFDSVMNSEVNNQLDSLSSFLKRRREIIAIYEEINRHLEDLNEAERQILEILEQYGVKIKNYGDYNYTIDVGDKSTRCFHRGSLSYGIARASVIKDWLWDFKRKEKNDWVKEYLELEKELNEINVSNRKSPFKKLRIASIKKRMKEIAGYRDVEEFLKEREIYKVLLIVDKIYLEPHRIEYNSLNAISTHEYNIRNKVKELNKTIEKFHIYLLIDIYKHNYEALKYQKTPLKDMMADMIKSYNISCNFKEHFDYWMISYDLAEQMAKENGVDFQKLKPEEKFRYCLYAEELRTLIGKGYRNDELGKIGEEMQQIYSKIFETDYVPFIDLSDKEKEVVLKNYALAYKLTKKMEAEKQNSTDIHY